MKVIIGCEESGVGRRAFRERGHHCRSVDLLPARDGKAIQHAQMDIVAFLEACSDGWYDLGIFHPECTSVCVAGNKTYAPGGVPTQARLDQIEWIIALWHLAKRKCKRVCFENPASVIWPHLRKLGADVQYVQPYEFGHLEQKRTGLGLYNLPRLAPTNNVFAEMMRLPKHERERIHYMSPSKTRSRDHSESFAGIMDAMANQWGALDNMDDARSVL